MAFDSGRPDESVGIFHSNVTSGLLTVFGKLMITLCPVDLTYPKSTSRPSAVAQSLAIGPPPVSAAMWLVPSNQRGDMTQLYLLSKSRLAGLGIVCWFHGCLRSTGLPSGSRVTNISWSSQSS